MKNLDSLRTMLLSLGFKPCQLPDEYLILFWSNNDIWLSWFKTSPLNDKILKLKYVRFLSMIDELLHNIL